MSRKLYLPSTGAAAISPAFDSGWWDTSSATRIAAVWDAPSATAFSSVTVTAPALPDSSGLASGKRYINTVLVRQYVSPPIIGTWTATTAMPVGYIILDPSGYSQQVITAGTTGGTIPGTWNHAGGNTTDGGVTWANLALGLPATYVTGYMRSSGAFTGGRLSGLVRGCPSVAKIVDSGGTTKHVFSRLFPLANSTTYQPSGSVYLNDGFVQTGSLAVGTFADTLRTPQSIAAGDRLVIEVGYAVDGFGGDAAITAASATQEFGDAASSDITLYQASGVQANPFFALGTPTPTGGIPTPPTPPSFSGAWLVINEPSVGLTDQSARLHVPSGSSFSTILRQRGTAEINIFTKSADSYEPTLGAQVFLYDVTPTASTLVFAGTIDEITHTGAGTSGDRFAKLSCVSLEQVFDAILIPPRAYQNQTAGYIVADLLALCSGAPVTAGPIGAGATIANLTCDYDSVASVFDKLATASKYTWGVDPQTQTLYFRDPATNAAPFTFTSGILRYGAFDRKVSRKDFRDRQIVRLSPDAFAHSSELFTGTNSPPQTVTVRNPIKEIVNVWTTKNTQNTATATFSGQPSANDTVTITYPASGSTYNWAATSPYTAGQIIIDSANHIQRVTTGGTSGGSTPSFNHAGSTTVDGSVIWTDAGVNGAGGTGSSVYTFVATLDNTLFGQVLIGSSTAATCQNLIDAINSTDAKKGVKFSLPTWENPMVNADAISGTHFTIRNKSAGAGYVAALSKSCANFAWSNATTTGGGTTFGTVNLQVAVEGTSNTANAYYTPGQKGVKIIPAVDGSTYIQVEYTRIGGDTVIVEDSALVATRAAVENGTGKYQVETSDTSQTSNTAGLAEAQATLTAYKALPTELTLTTYQPGLMPGQTLTVALDATAQPVIAGLLNGSYVVQEVSGQLVPTADYVGQNGHYEYTVRVIDQAQVGTWLDFWQGLSSGGGSGSGTLVAGSGTSGLAGGSSGGVTSITVTAPAEIGVTGSPVTTAGTIALSWASTAQNRVFAGPTSGTSGNPAFRSLVVQDFDSSKIQGDVTLKLQMSNTATTGQPAFYNSTGSLTPQPVRGTNLRVQLADSGSVTSGHVASFDSNGNLTDSGVASSAVGSMTVRANATTYTNPLLEIQTGDTHIGLAFSQTAGVKTILSLTCSGFLTTANNLSDITSPSVARGNLGLGDASTHAASDFATASDISGVYSTIAGLGSTYVAFGYSFNVYGSDFNDSLGFPCSGTASITL
jgi:hypothetical protein